jgi:hypothetical protein
VGKKCKSHVQLSHFAGEHVGMIQDGLFLCVGKIVQCLIFSPPIGLDTSNFAVKLSFNKVLEILEASKTLRFFTNEVNPNKFTVIIIETYIISIFANRNWGGPPYIGKNKFHGSRGHTTRLRIRQLMMFA